MNTATLERTSSVFARIPLDLIDPSDSNPRTVPPGTDIVAAWELQELADDIERNDVLQPILLRPHPSAPGDRYELIAGERRWRASALAGKADIPAMVRVCTDRQARELQVIENDDHKPLPPLDLARGYANLLAGLEQDGFATAEELAAHLGKPVGHVRQHLQLLKLCPEAKAALWAGTLGVGQVLPLVRIATHEAQAEALAAIIKGFGGEPFSAKAARDHVQQHHLLRLDKAPFDIATADWPTLLEDPGRCTTCPKRSGAEPGLFDGEAVAGDLCRDAACFKAKTQAHHDAERKLAQQAAAKAKAAQPAAAPKPAGAPAAPPAAPAMPATQASATPAAAPAPAPADAQAMVQARHGTHFGRALFDWLHTRLASREAFWPGLRITARAMFEALSYEASALLYGARGWPLPGQGEHYTIDFGRRLPDLEPDEVLELLIEMPIAELLTAEQPPQDLEGTDAQALAQALGMTAAMWQRMDSQALATARQAVAGDLGIARQAKARQKREDKAQAKQDATAAFAQAHAAAKPGKARKGG